jgi:hypothetical protein
VEPAVVPLKTTFINGNGSRLMMSTTLPLTLVVCAFELLVTAIEAITIKIVIEKINLFLYHIKIQSTNLIYLL